MMKVHITRLIIVLLLLPIGNFARTLEPLIFNASYADIKLEQRSPNSPETAGTGEPIPGPDPPLVEEGVWNKAKCRGQKLLLAMTMDPDIAAKYVSPIQSPWEGDLIEEMNTWGYKDDSAPPFVDKKCQFSTHHGLSRAFEGLGIDPRSRGEGGPNRCYRIVHQSSPAVQKLPDGKFPPTEEQRYTVAGKEYKVTGAFNLIGINLSDGIVYFLYITSPFWSAEMLWERTPSQDELPELRAISDLTWGLWNRDRDAAPSLQHITKLMSINVVNDDTVAIIKQALWSKEPSPGQERITTAPKWPGIEFSTADEAGQALLGSQNGIGSAYFLAQHKNQLGGNKYIDKITIVGAGNDDGGSPNMIFWVKDAPNPPVPPETEMEASGKSAVDASLSQVVHRGVNDRSFLRSHIFRAKL